MGGPILTIYTSLFAQRVAFVTMIASVLKFLVVPIFLKHISTLIWELLQLYVLSVITYKIAYHV